eukprot:362781-Chlamydomonas_euryale.AAC.2
MRTLIHTEHGQPCSPLPCESTLSMASRAPHSHVNCVQPAVLPQGILARDSSIQPGEDPPTCGLATGDPCRGFRHPQGGIIMSVRLFPQCYSSIWLANRLGACSEALLYLF